MSSTRQPVLVTLLVAATIITGCGTSAGTGPSTATRQPESLTVASSPAPVAALATDQTCTRTAPAGATLRSVRYRADDLEAMTLFRTALPTAVRAYPIDWNDYGFMDNVELPKIQLGPKSLCTINRANGRITGFSRGFSGAQTVWTANHLFFTAPAATSWLKAYVAGMRALPGSKGISSVQVTSLASSLGTGAVRIVARCSSGCRLTHVLFQRGQIIGSVWDGHGPGVANVLDAVYIAKKLAGQIVRRTATVNARAQTRTDAVMQLSAGLPKSALGSRYTPLVWDWFFGGCWDVQEAASQTNSAGEARAYRAAAARYGQLTFCRAMYAPAAGTSVNRVERVFTGGTLYATASGASGALADIVNTWRQRAHRTVGGTAYGALVRPGVPTLGDQVVALQQRAGASTLTRIYVRRGSYLAVAALNARAFTGMTADVRRWAVALDRRVAALLTTRRF